MLTQTSPEQRLKFYLLHQRGESYQTLAVQSGFSPECVRYWCRRQRDGGGCCSRYTGRPAGQLKQFDDLIRYWVLRFKLKHCHWGPGRILTHLKNVWLCEAQNCPAPPVSGVISINGRVFSDEVRKSHSASVQIDLQQYISVGKLISR